MLRSLEVAMADTSTWIHLQISFASICTWNAVVESGGDSSRKTDTRACASANHWLDYRHQSSFSVDEQSEHGQLNGVAMHMHACMHTGAFPVASTSQRATALRRPAAGRAASLTPS